MTQAKVKFSRFAPGKKAEMHSPVIEESVERIDEVLSDKQKDKVDSWYTRPAHDVKKMHDAVFGEGNNKVVIPVHPKTEDNVINSENIGKISRYGSASHANAVNSFLAKNSYRIHDYEAGLTHHVDTPDRKISIGKVLSRLGADTAPTAVVANRRVAAGKTPYLSVKEAYDADPVRQKAPTHVVISRDKYDVAGMTSPGDEKAGIKPHPWHDASCMNFASGCNRHYLKRDLEHGTLVVHGTSEANPEELKDPTSRLLLKHHTGMMTDHNTVIPESSHYGAMPPRVKSTVDDWVNKNYPKQNDVYVKNPNLYNDDGQGITHKHYDPSKVSEGLEPQKAAEKVYDHVQDYAEKAYDAAEENMDREIEKDNYSDIHPGVEAYHSTKHLMDKMYAGMDDKTKAHYAFHIATKSIDNKAGTNGNRDNHYEGEEITDIGSTDRFSDASLTHHDIQPIAAHSGPIAAKNSLFTHAKHLSDETLHAHIRDVQHSIEHHGLDDSDVGAGTHMHETYDALTKELFDRHHDHPEKHQGAVDEVINHHIDNLEAHEALQNEHSNYKYVDHTNGLDTPKGTYNGNNTGYLKHTTSVPIMHKVMDKLEEHRGDGHYGNGNGPGDALESNSSLSKSPPMAHFGKHSNEEFAHRIFHEFHKDAFPDEPEHGENYIDHDEFVRGLNHNKHGEIIQHSLTSQFHFPTEHENDDGHNLALHTLARHSTIPSVLHKLATRSDISDEVKNTAKATMHKLNIGEGDNEPSSSDIHSAIEYGHLGKMHSALLSKNATPEHFAAAKRIHGMDLDAKNVINSAEATKDWAHA